MLSVTFGCASTLSLRLLPAAGHVGIGWWRQSCRSRHLRYSWLRQGALAGTARRGAAESVNSTLCHLELQLPQHPLEWHSSSTAVSLRPHFAGKRTGSQHELCSASRQHSALVQQHAVQLFRTSRSVANKPRHMTLHGCNSLRQCALDGWLQ